MEKKGGGKRKIFGRRNWRRRYFVLEHGFLAYWADKYGPWFSRWWRSEWANHNARASPGHRVWKRPRHSRTRVSRFDTIVFICLSLMSTKTMVAGSRCGQKLYVTGGAEP